MKTRPRRRARRAWPRGSRRASAQDRPPGGNEPARSPRRARRARRRRPGRSAGRTACGRAASRAQARRHGGGTPGRSGPGSSRRRRSALDRVRVAAEREPGRHVGGEAAELVHHVHGRAAVRQALPAAVKALRNRPQDRIEAGQPARGQRLHRQPPQRAPGLALRGEDADQAQLVGHGLEGAHAAEGPRLRAQRMVREGAIGDDEDAPRAHAKPVHAASAQRPSPPDERAYDVRRAGGGCPAAGRPAGRAGRRSGARAGYESWWFSRRARRSRGEPPGRCSPRTRPLPVRLPSRRIRGYASAAAGACTERADAIAQLPALLLVEAVVDAAVDARVIDVVGDVLEARVVEDDVRDERGRQRDRVAALAVQALGDLAGAAGGVA